MSKIIIDVATSETCYATLWSYGEICIGCNCCNENTKIRHKARLKYWKWWLRRNIEFDSWAEDTTTVTIQKKNIKTNIREARQKIRYYLDKIK